jgi:hypothetical protein
MDDQRAPSHMIHLHSRDNYGEQKEIEGEFKAMDCEDYGFGLGLGRALKSYMLNISCMLFCFNAPRFSYTII